MNEDELRDSMNERMGRPTVDPEETLRRMLEIAAKLTDPGVFITDVEERAAGEELGELTQSMHGWLSKGGFLPKAWQR